MASITPASSSSRATFQEALSSIPCPQQAQAPVRQTTHEGITPVSIETKAYNLRSSTTLRNKVYNPSLNQSSRPLRPLDNFHLDSVSSIPSTYNNNQDFVLSDHFADTRTIQSHLCNYLEAHTKQLSALQALLITSIAKDNIDNNNTSSVMSSVPATPPQHQTDLGMVNFKTSDGDFDPLSFLNDFDSIPVPTTYRQADFATSAAPLANAFQAFRDVAGLEDTSPTFTPFGLDDDTPPVNTPALEADDGSTITSPVWNDFSSFNLFPTCGQTDLLGSAFSKTSFVDASTVSPTDLALPLSLPSIVPPAAAPVAQKRKTNPKKRSATPADDAYELDAADQAPLPKRKRQTSQATFTGTRNTVVPYVSVDAPTQTRQYHGPPSKTSKRDVPAAAAKKVAALKAQAAMMGTDAPEEAIAQSIEEKRRQNTVAARRSRLRKAEHLATLEEQVRNQQQQLAALQAERDRLELEKQAWMARAIHAGWKET